jgi:hypothetical protein
MLAVVSIAARTSTVLVWLVVCAILVTARTTGYTKAHPTRAP